MLAKMPVIMTHITHIQLVFTLQTPIHPTKPSPSSSPPASAFLFPAIHGFSLHAYPCPVTQLFLFVLNLPHWLMALRRIRTRSVLPAPGTKPTREALQLKHATYLAQVRAPMEGEEESAFVEREWRLDQEPKHTWGPQG